MAAWRKLFSKPDTKTTAETYPPVPVSSSNSSSSRSLFTDDADSEPAATKMTSWLKRKASKVSSPAGLISRPLSKRGRAKLSKPDMRMYYDRDAPRWREPGRPFTSDRGRGYGSTSWSFSTLDEASTSSEEDVHIAARRGSDELSDVVAESSVQALRRREDQASRHDSHSSPMSQRTRSNNSDTWNRLSTPSTRGSKVAERDVEDGADPASDRNSLRDSGVRLSHSAESIDGQERVKDSRRTGSLDERRRSWGEEDSEHRKATNPLETQGSATQEQDILGDEWSDTSSGADNWWEDGHEHDILAEDTANTTIDIEIPANVRSTPEQADHEIAGGSRSHQNGSEDEWHSLYEDAPHSQTQETTERLRELEDAVDQIGEQVAQMDQYLISTWGDLHAGALELAEDEIRGLEDAAQQMRAEIARLRNNTDKPSTLTAGNPFSADLISRLQAESGTQKNDWPFTAALQEERDRQHALRLQAELEEESASRRESEAALFAEQEELDRQHALQLQQDMETEHQEAQRQQQADRMRDCTVCAESKPPIDFPLHSPTTQCTHPPGLCYTCLHSWMASELDSKGSSAFKCPECPATMSFSDIRAAASEETFTAYDKLAMRSALGGLEEFAWCLRSGCGNGQLNVENNHYMICQACGYRQCLKHQIEWHRGETCEEYDYRVSGRKAADEARERKEVERRERREEERKAQEEAKRKVDDERKTAAMIGSVSKACPANCGRRIQRNRGCDHMTCKCGHEFCWECLAPHRSIDRQGNTAHQPSCKNHSNNLN